MFFRKSKKKVKQSMGTMDKVVTGVIIGGAAASIFGLSRTEKGKNLTKQAKSGGTSLAKKGYKLFGKITLKVLDLFDKKK